MIGCKAKKSMVTTEIVTEKETITDVQLQKITLPSNNTVLFNLKDSLGSLKDFIWNSKNGLLETSIQIKNGQLEIVNKNDSIVQKFDSINRNYEKKELKAKEVRVEVIPFKVYIQLYSLIAVVVILLAYIIYRKFKK